MAQLGTENNSPLEGKMNTRELATFLRSTADYLDSVPEFEAESVFQIVPNHTKKIPQAGLSFWDKDKFIEAVKALGNATKSYDTSDYPYLRVTAVAFPFQVNISRDKVCKKIVTYDCGPLFSTEEVNSL